MLAHRRLLQAFLEDVFVTCNLRDVSLTMPEPLKIPSLHNRSKSRTLLIYWRMFLYDVS